MATDTERQFKRYMQGFALALVAVVVGDMTAKQALTPLLALLAGAGGGYAASWLFARIRISVRFMAFVLRCEAGNAAQQWLATLLRYLVLSKAVGLSVFVTSTLISGSAAAALAYLSGESINRALAIFCAFFVSQIRYLLLHPDPDPLAPRPTK